MKKPKYLITYLCLSCFSANTYADELESPVCVNCETRDKLVGIKKERFSRKAIDEKILLLNDRLMEELKKEYVAGGLDADYDEDYTLKRIASGKKLKKIMKTKTLSQEELKKYLNP